MSSNDIYSILISYPILDKTGRICGPRLPKLPKEIIELINVNTTYLNCCTNINLKVRIKAILLNYPPIKYCPICNKCAAINKDSKIDIFL